MWVIEFRNGLFFQSLEANHGGPKNTAQKFENEKKAKIFMKKNSWVLFNGGMAMEIENKAT